jgi:polar amino acid transport system ATP-binding protein
MSATPILRLDGIAKSYGKIKALRGVDLTVEHGQVVCIVGPSGCGKSTLLRCVNFLEEPEEGIITIEGEPMGFRHIQGRRRRDSESNINRMRSKIGMVFQQFNVWPHLSAFENVIAPQVYVKGSPRAEAAERARILLERVGLADKCGSYPSELSGGQLQRVAIARALAMEPKLLLFDEPTSALDPELVAEVLTVMRELAKAGRTMIVVTHELRFASEIADRIIFMDAGQIIEDGPPQAVLENAKSERLRQFAANILNHKKGFERRRAENPASESHAT